MNATLTKKKELSPAEKADREFRRWAFTRAYNYCYTQIDERAVIEGDAKTVGEPFVILLTDILTGVMADKEGMPPPTRGIEECFGLSRIQNRLRSKDSVATVVVNDDFVVKGVGVTQELTLDTAAAYLPDLKHPGAALYVCGKADVMRGAYRAGSMNRLARRVAREASEIQKDADLQLLPAATQQGLLAWAEAPLDGDTGNEELDAYKQRAEQEQQ